MDDSFTSRQAKPAIDKAEMQRVDSSICDHLMQLSPQILNANCPQLINGIALEQGYWYFIKDSIVPKCTESTYFIAYKSNLHRISNSFIHRCLPSPLPCASPGSNYNKNDTAQSSDYRTLAINICEIFIKNLDNVVNHYTEKWNNLLRDLWESPKVPDLATLYRVLQPAPYIPLFDLMESFIQILLPCSVELFSNLRRTKRDNQDVTDNESTQHIMQQIQLKESLRENPFTLLSHLWEKIFVDNTLQQQSTRAQQTQENLTALRQSIILYDNEFNAALNTLIAYKTYKMISAGYCYRQSESSAPITRIIQINKPNTDAITKLVLHLQRFFTEIQNAIQSTKEVPSPIIANIVPYILCRQSRQVMDKGIYLSPIGAVFGGSSAINKMFMVHLFWLQSTLYLEYKKLTISSSNNDLTLYFDGAFDVFDNYCFDNDHLKNRIEGLYLKYGSDSHMLQTETLNTIYTINKIRESESRQKIQNKYYTPGEMRAIEHYQRASLINIIMEIISRLTLHISLCHISQQYIKTFFTSAHLRKLHNEQAYNICDPQDLRVYIIYIAHNEYINNNEL